MHDGNVCEKCSKYEIASPHKLFTICTYFLHKKAAGEPSPLLRYFYSSAKISAAFVSGLTLGITFAILPSSSIIKVVRATPKLVLP